MFNLRVYQTFFITNSSFSDFIKLFTTLYKTLQKFEWLSIIIKKEIIATIQNFYFQ